MAGGFQQGQPERYSAEREAARERLGARNVATVVVAPASNRQVLGEPAFDASIRLEEIVDYLRVRIDELSHVADRSSAELTRRLRARVGLLEALAGKRTYSTWSPNPVPERVGFMERYRQLAKHLAPHLTATSSSGGPQSSSVLFSGISVKGVPIGKARHDFGKSQCVSIELKRAGAAKQALVDSGILPPGATLNVTSAGTLMLRLTTEPIVGIDARFDDQRSAVEDAIRKVLSLESCASANAGTLVQMLATVPPSETRPPARTRKGL